MEFERFIELTCQLCDGTTGHTNCSICEGKGTYLVKVNYEFTSQLSMLDKLANAVAAYRAENGFYPEKICLRESEYLELERASEHLIVAKDDKDSGAPKFMGIPIEVEGTKVFDENLKIRWSNDSSSV